MFLSASLTTLQLYLLPVSILFPMFLSASLTALQIYLRLVLILFPLFLQLWLHSILFHFFVSFLIPFFLRAALSAHYPGLTFA